MLRGAAARAAALPQQPPAPPPDDFYAPPPDAPPPGDFYAPPPGDFHAPPPDDPHPDSVLIQSQPGELRKQSDRDETVFDDYVFRLCEHDGKMVLEFWDEQMPNQSVKLESRCITKIFKGFDESQHGHATGAIGLQLNYSLFPSLRSREKHLRVKFTSISVRSQWLTYLVEGTGLTPEDPHEHLHVTSSTVTQSPASVRSSQEAHVQANVQRIVSPPPGSPPTHAAAQPAGYDSSDDEHQASARRPKRIEWNDDESSDSVVESVGGAAARHSVVPTSPTSRAWWQDKQVPPWELDATYKRATTGQSVFATSATPSAPVDAGTVRSEVVSLQLHRASRTAARLSSPDGLRGQARFERMQNLDSRLSELRRQRQQRMSQRDGSTMRADVGMTASSSRPSVGSLDLARRGSRDAPSSRLLATRRAMPSGHTSMSSNYQAEGVQSTLNQDLQNVRAKRAELEAKLSSMQAQRASRSMQMSATEAASAIGGSTMMKGEGSAPVRAKRLHISMSAGPEYVGTSSPTRVLFDPTISVGAFDRLLRRQMGLNPQMYISLANERGELMAPSEALGLPDGALLYLRHDSPPPSPPGSDLDMEEGEPPSPPASLNGATGDSYAGGDGYSGYDGYAGDIQLAGEGQYDQAGEWHAGALDDRGVWQDVMDDGPPKDPSAGAQFICVRKQQAYSAFDPAEKGGKKTEKVKKGQTITAIETRELPGRHGSTLRIHYEGGWVSQTAGNKVCFVRK